MNPLVTVLIPFKDVGEYFKLCIESVLESRYNNFELLLINDSSSDNSFQIAERFSQKDSRISLCHSPKQGLVSALNFGLNNAKGDYIARMDGDDICHPDRLKKQMDVLINQPDITLTSSLVHCFSDEKITQGFKQYMEWVNNCLTNKQMHQGLFIESPLVHPSVTFRKYPVQKLGGYRDYPGPEDYDLWIRLAEASCQFHKIPEILLSWRIHSSSFSRTNERYHPKAFEKRKFTYLLNRLQQNLSQDRALYIMGAGKMGGRLGKFLVSNQLNVSGFIDIDPKKQGGVRQGLPVCSPDQFFQQNPPGFVLGYVTSWGAREIISQNLQASQRIQGKDYLIL